MILKARAENGSSSAARRWTTTGSSPRPSGSIPSTAGTSSGDGRKSTTASSRSWTPLFLKAVPQITGTKGASSSRTEVMTRLRRAARISSSLIASPPRYFSSSLSSASLTFSMSFSRYCCASASMSSGMSPTM